MSEKARRLPGFFVSGAMFLRFLVFEPWPAHSSLVYQQPSLPRFPHHTLDLTLVILLLSLLLAPVLVAPVFDVCGRYRGSACGRFVA